MTDNIIYLEFTESDGYSAVKVRYQNETVYYRNAAKFLTESKAVHIAVDVHGGFETVVVRDDCAIQYMCSTKISVHGVKHYDLPLAYLRGKDVTIHKDVEQMGVKTMIEKMLE